MNLGQLIGFAYASLFGFVLPLTFFSIAVFAGRRREAMLSRERVIAMEHGIPPAFLQRPRPRRQMSPRAGALVLLAAGLGLCFGLWQSGNAEWGWGALPTMIGAALLLHWQLGGAAVWQRQRALDEDLQRAYIEQMRRTELNGRPRSMPEANDAPRFSAAASPGSPAGPADQTIAVQPL